jgi:hypothetical protein
LASQRTEGSRVTPSVLDSDLPVVLALRVGLLAVTLLTARRPGVARRVAFLGSAAASLLTGLVAAEVLWASAPVRGVLFVHQASGLALEYSIDGLSA